MTSLLVLILVGVVSSSCVREGPVTPDDSPDPGELAVTTPYPLTDLGPGTYLGFEGGLYPGGSNTMPSTHATIGAAFVSQIRPLDAQGRVATNGKIVLLSLGMSNATQEFCGGPPTSCQSISFIGQALADPAVDKSKLVIVDGAQGAQVVDSWVSPTDTTYNVVRDERLAALHVTEAQVQVVWIKQAMFTRTSLPEPGSDPYRMEFQLGNIVRTLRVRYPNVKVVFLSSRIYGGYAAPGTLNPEPFAFESGFAVKWLIEAQINEEQSLTVEKVAGDLYPGVDAPWLAWGPYLWANGMTPRKDGLVYSRDDFAADATHPADGARRKVGAMLLQFLKTSPYSQCWFLAGRSC
jgi:hypothetical protein